MLRVLTSLSFVVSGGASCANESGAPMSPAAPADDSVARKRRRLCIVVMTGPLSLELSRYERCQHGQPFSSRLSSLKNRQSVPAAMILAGLDLIMPASRNRRA